MIRYAIDKRRALSDRVAVEHTPLSERQTDGPSVRLVCTPLLVGSLNLFSKLALGESFHRRYTYLD